jgi:hypothetical protein
MHLLPCAQLSPCVGFTGVGVGCRIGWPQPPNHLAADGTEHNSSSMNFQQDISSAKNGSLLLPKLSAALLKN